MADRAKPLEYAPTGALYRGSQIRAVRQAKGWSLTHFGQLLACQLSALSNIETNRVAPSARLLARIATLLEVPLAELEQAPLPPLLAAKATGRTTPSRPTRPPRPLTAAPTPPADPVPAEVGRWTFGPLRDVRQVRAVGAEGLLGHLLAGQLGQEIGHIIGHSLGHRWLSSPYLKSFSAVIPAVCDRYR